MDAEWVIADAYRRYRPLPRPQTDIWRFLGYIAIVAGISSCIALAVICLLIQQGVIEWGGPLFNRFLLYSGIAMVATCLAMHKVIMLKCIELYQHYAPEHIRRKCIFMPSCSVYAMLAIRKYNTFKAIRMILKRLSNCCGTVATIDYP